MNDNSNQIKLSQRLALIANQVLEGSRIADIGSDHALLPVYLAQQGKIISAIAGELNEGPYLAACRQVKLYQLESIIHVRHGDGLSVIGSDEIDTIIIAGMGGSTMVHILEQGLNQLTSVNRIIVQPNVGEMNVREWFEQENWLLQEEFILEEDGLIYEILVAVPATTDEQKISLASLYDPIELDNGTQVDSALLKLMGPYLVREASSVFRSKWLQEIGKREWIINHLNKSEQEQSLVKRKQLEAEIISIRNVSQ